MADSQEQLKEKLVESSQVSAADANTILESASPESPQQVTLAYSSATNPRENSHHLGHYEILAEVARGGMGVIYKAIDLQLDRLVAIKLIKSGELADSQQIQRFQVEAKAAAQLEHVGIVPVYEVGQFGSQHFMAMAFVDGRSLWEEVKESPLPARRAAALMQKVAEAVQYAHEQGIVHRDLKPQNILVTKDDQPKVTDFGLAKRQGGDSSLTETGQALGTPSYMPPEQAKGNIKEIGPLADVYSLGASLYCLLTGRPPFQAATILETMQQVVEQEPVSPKSLNRSVSSDLETICLKCLEKLPARRYSSAGALADDLKRFLAHEPILARPIGLLERTWRWCHRNRALAGMLLIAALLPVAVATVSTAAYLRESKLVLEKEGLIAEKTGLIGEKENLIHKQNGLINEKEALIGEKEGLAQLERIERNRADEINRNLKHQNYLHRIALAYREWQEGNVRTAEEYLDGCPEEHRSWEWHYCRRLCQQPQYSVPGFQNWIRSIAYSPDGRQIAAAADGSNVMMLSAADGSKIWGLQIPAAPGAYYYTGTNLAYSPTGQHIAVGCWDGMLRILNAADGTEFRSLKAKNTHVDSVAISPNGDRIAAFSQPLEKAGGGGGDIEVWSISSGELLFTIAGTSMGYPQLAFSPDGERLAGAGHLGMTTLWEAGTGREVLTLRGPESLVLCIAFSPDSKRLASGCNDAMIRVWDLAEGKTALIIRQQQGNIRAITFSRDGKRIVSSGEDYLIRFWDSTDGRELFNLKGCVLPVMALAISPDDQQVAAGGLDAMVTTWHASGDGAYQSIPTAQLQALTLTRDGGQIVSANKTMLQTWDSRSGKAGQQLNIPCSWLTFSPDGKTLAVGAVTGTDPNAVRLVDWEKGQELRVLGTHMYPATGAAFTPDGKWVTTVGHDGAVRVWDLQSSDEVFTVSQNGRLHCLALAPDGRYVAVGGDAKTVKILDLMERKFVNEVPNPGNQVRTLAYSPDGSRLIVGCLNGAARVYDPTTGKVLTILKGHSNWIRSAAFSPDQKRILTGSNDLSAKLWDAVTGEEVMTLRGHKQPVACVAFSSDGRRIYTAEVITVRIWDAGPEAASLKNSVEPVTQPD